MEFKRALSVEGTHPYDSIEWVRKDIEVRDGKDCILFKCPNAEFPITWSQEARNVVAQKYFRISRKNDQRETSVKQMIDRVVQFIVAHGKDYFKDTESQNIYKDELTLILVNQIATFNSPVWFNVGVPGVEVPQASACFINSVEDSMESILELAKTEGLIFKEGSGSGVNFSTLRGSNEEIRGGGTASGPVSFMQGFDAFANTILSGGRLRRAARMCILNIDHPDIQAFINCKAQEEEIAKILALGGLDPKFNSVDSAYAHVRHQSGNNSVRVTDAFMQKVQEIWHGYIEDAPWDLKNINSPTVSKTVSVKELFQSIAEAAHKCGDPGIQFHDTVNKYNTCSNDAQIVASNPCSEFVFLNNSACNLSSINLDKFVSEPGNFNTKLFKHVIRVMIVAQDILCSAASYPTDAIRVNTQKYRPLGLGFSNLGGMLMSWGIPYDSEKGRCLASSITSLMTAQAYRVSAEMAEKLQPFERFKDNAEPMEDVLQRHFNSTKNLPTDIAGVKKSAVNVWKEVVQVFGTKKEKGSGFRNAQVTLIAPTGTISLMMDCATTGAEPDIALRKQKHLVGGETVKYLNPNVSKALNSLGYDKDTVNTIMDYVIENGHLENSKLKEEHLPVFDCALPVASRLLTADAHLKMVAAIQPFVSGAISKTINLPPDTTPEQVSRTFLKAWELGLKCVTVYRKGSKLGEPLQVENLKNKIQETQKHAPKRERLPDTRKSETHHFGIGGHDGYFTVGFYPDSRRIGELFIRMASQGSVVSGVLDAFATSVSLNLQHGVPIEDLITKFKPMNFTPNGVTRNQDIPLTRSIVSYIFTFIEKNYTDKVVEEHPADEYGLRPSIMPLELEPISLDGEICPQCGNIMRLSGTCYTCENCTFNSGVCQ